MDGRWRRRRKGREGQPLQRPPWWGMWAGSSEMGTDAEVDAAAGLGLGLGQVLQPPRPEGVPALWVPQPQSLAQRVWAGPSPVFRGGNENGGRGTRTRVDVPVTLAQAETPPP